MEKIPIATFATPSGPKPEICETFILSAFSGGTGATIVMVLSNLNLTYVCVCVRERERERERERVFVGRLMDVMRT